MSSSGRELSATYGRLGDEIPHQLARAGKGGGIGVGNKGVIALRFDDYHDAFKTTVLPLLKARGLPCSLASISRLSTQPWTGTVTTAEVAQWNRDGVEIWSHGTDHKDPTPQGDAGLVDQIVTSKAEIEAWGVKCQGWAQPGATPLTAEIPYGTYFYEVADYHTTRAGRLIAETYPLSEGYALGIPRAIPFPITHGLDHTTVSDGMSLATAKTWVDRASGQRQGVEMMCHAGNLGGGSGKMTVAEFTELLDYIVAAWDAGTIEVLTPSGLAFADRGDYRLDLLRDGDFENVTTGSTVPWAVFGTKTIETSGGHSGSRFLRILPTDTATISQRPKLLANMALNGETFLFEGWCRATPGGATGLTVARVLFLNYDSAGVAIPSTQTALKTGVTTAWTRFRFPLSLHPNTDELQVALSRNSGDGIDWDDVHVWKV